jgi:hypothetical protein
MPIPKFNASTWFAQFTAGGAAIPADELQPVLEFTLVWNLFEKLVCERNAGLPRIRRHVDQSIDQNMINGADYHPFVEFFQERYEDPSEEFLISVLLSSRRLPSRVDREDIRLVKEVLVGNYSDANNVIYALLFIAYRIRNNLFHGEKAVETLHLQKELFETVNAFLSKYMSDTALAE